MTTTDRRTDAQTSRAEELEASAKQEAAAVKQSVAAAGKEAAATLSEQSAAVADTAKQQFDTIIGQAKQEFSSQANAQGQQVIRGLHTLTDEVSALASGRPQEAGQLGTLVGDAEQRLRRYVSSLDTRGPQALVDDVARFARRRPAMFLLGAGLVGFAVGRLVRSAADQDGGADGTQAMRRSEDWTQRAPAEQFATVYAAPQEEPWQTPS